MALSKKIFEIGVKVAPVAKPLSVNEVESTELQKLADGYTSKDKATRNRVLEILGIKA